MDPREQQLLFDEKLLNEFMKRPPLFDKTSAFYKDRNMKENMWLSIGAAMASPAAFCETRVKQLRERYNREKREYMRLNPSGTSPVPQPSWPLFNHCKFLDDHIKPRKTGGNFSEIIEEEVDSNSSSSYYIEVNNELVNLSTVEEDNVIPLLRASSPHHVQPSVISSSRSTVPGTVVSTVPVGLQRSSLFHSPYITPAPRVLNSASSSPVQYLSSSCSPISISSPPSPQTTLSNPSPVISNKTKVLGKGRPSKSKACPSEDLVVAQMKRLAEVADKVVTRRASTPPPMSDDAAFAKLVENKMAPLPQDVKDDLQIEILSLINRATKAFRQSL